MALIAPFLLRGDGWNASAFVIFAAVGVVFPAVVTLLNFASNRLTGPTIAGTVSSTTPLFAVFVAILFLSEPLTVTAAAGTAATVLGVIAFTTRGEGVSRHWAAWAIVLPIVGAAIRGVGLTEQTERCLEAVRRVGEQCRNFSRAFVKEPAFRAARRAAGNKKPRDRQRAERHADHQGGVSVERAVGLGVHRCSLSTGA